MSGFSSELKVLKVLKVQLHVWRCRKTRVGSSRDRLSRRPIDCVSTGRALRQRAHQKQVARTCTCFQSRFPPRLLSVTDSDASEDPGGPLSAKISRVRVELDRLVSRRAGHSTRKQDAYDFEEKWLQAGMAKREPNGHGHATCLNQNRSDATGRIGAKTKASAAFIRTAP